MKKIILNKINKNNFSIAIIGLGYVGLPLALTCAKSKIKTYGYDNDKYKIETLKNKKSYIKSINNSLIRKYSKNNFYPSSNFKNISNQDIIIICVPTPLKKNNTPDLNYVINVIKEIKDYIRKGQTIILECTSYPGTTEEYFLPMFKKKKFKVGKNIFLGYSPEREDPGNRKFSVLKKNIPKVVSGYTHNCLQIVQSFYKIIAKKVLPVQSIRTAEFTKLLENIYRSVNIGLINELAEVCHKMKINIYESIRAASSKPFGFSAFYPGPGVGGHCIPIDPLYLTWKAKKFGINTKFIKLAATINEKKPLKIFLEILKIIKKIKRERKSISILVLGVSYKKNSDDVRGSPCLKIINKLSKSYSGNINICDPHVNFEKLKLPKKINLIQLKNVYNQIKYRKIDILIILNNHNIFDIKKIANKSELIIDAVNATDNIDHKKIINL